MNGRGSLRTSMIDVLFREGLVDFDHSRARLYIGGGITFFKVFFIFR
jgi:hypothetical protein